MYLQVDISMIENRYSECTLSVIVDKTNSDALDVTNSDTVDFHIGHYPQYTYCPAPLYKSCNKAFDIEDSTPWGI